MKILFFHGMESGPGGRKAQYLARNFPEVVTPDLRPWWLPCLALWKAARANVSVKPDVVVASSLGAVFCSLLMLCGVVKCPVVLLAPPFCNILRWCWRGHLSVGKPLVLVHGSGDNLSGWRDMLWYSHRNLRQIVIDDQHALKTLLQDDGLIAVIAVAVTCRQLHRCD